MLFDNINVTLVRFLVLCFEVIAHTVFLSSFFIESFFLSIEGAMLESTESHLVRLNFNVPVIICTAVFNFVSILLVNKLFILTAL